jgi:DNA-binding transcriptional LysR family regulator
MFSLQSLRAFRSIMEVGSVAGAADRIGRTQPQVSRLLSQLEEELGFELFLRDRKRLIPTEKAHQFYQQVIRTLQDFDQLKFYGEMLRQERQAYLRVLAPPYAAYTVLPEAIARFRQTYPEGRFSLEIVTRSSMGAWFSFRQFDIGIASLPFDAPSIEVTPLAEVPTVVAMAVDHPLAKKSAIDLHDLAAHPHVALNRFTLLRRQLDEILQREGVELNIVGETDTGFAACALAAEGVGVALVDRPWLDAAPRDRVVWRPWRPGLVSQFGLIRPANSPMSRPAALLASIVTEIFERRYGQNMREAQL